jgi:hypothetical protein
MRSAGIELKYEYRNLANVARYASFFPRKPPANPGNHRKSHDGTPHMNVFNVLACRNALFVQHLKTRARAKQ